MATAAARLASSAPTTSARRRISFRPGHVGGPRRCARGDATTRAQAASWGEPSGSGANRSWSKARKQIVEALVEGSGLARAPSVWYVDHDDTHAGSSAPPGSPERTRPNGASALGPTASELDERVSSDASTPSRLNNTVDRRRVMRVHARRAGVPHKALAHPESRERDALADELERHLEQGGATVLVAPLVDPLVVDLDDGDDDFETNARRGSARDASPSSSPSRRPRTFVEGTVCKCDPDDPGDCCARGLSTYVASCPVLASADEYAFDGLGAALAPGSSADEETGGENAFGGFPFGERAREEVLSCAFSRAVKEASKRRAAGHTNYYAAIVRSARGAGGAVTMDDGDAGEFGYEEFVIHRPAGDNWLGGAAPPPTTVRRASFGPKLRKEFERVCGERNE